MLFRSIPNAHLALVGDGPYREQLERHFAGTNTHFIGYLMGKELGAAYASADAFVFPSRTETLGLVLLEAMAAGCPVVAANAGGIPDIVTDGENGFLFDPIDEKGAIEAIQRLFSHDEYQLRTQARAEAERWSWAAATQQLQMYYEQIVVPATVVKPEPALPLRIR